MTTAVEGPHTVTLADGVTVSVTEAGSGEPLVLVNGTTQAAELWQPLVELFAARYRVITYDHRGMRESGRGDGPITVARLADDLDQVLAALHIEQCHVLGWSLGSAVVQELALAHPERVASAVLWGTWGRTDVFQAAVFTGLRHPWATGDVSEALLALGIAFSPELLNSEQFGPMMEQMLPLFPSTPGQVATTVEQWDADLAHDSLDRLDQITAPTLVVVGEQDLLTPPWQGRAVADRIPGARFELFTGPGSSHAVGLERAEEFGTLVLDFLAEHPLVHHA
ncbi:MAG: alpha/beta fold hydrolase [Mycobacteriaceae bacterium]